MLTTRLLHSIAKGVIWASVILLSKSLVAQVEVTITVDGPWTYVADPDNAKTRIVVIAPTAPNHDQAELAPKPSAHKSHIPTGSYNLDIQNLSACNSTTSNANLYHIDKIDSTKIRGAIAWKNSRYAFNLPKPCYYKEVFRNVEKISSTQINTNPDDVVGDTYTTTMELHYWVKAVTAATLTGTSDDGSNKYNDYVDFKNGTIKFIMSAGLLTANDEAACDSTSAASLLAAVKLFGEKRYVWFPMLSDFGQMGDPRIGNKGFFLEDCQKDNVRDQLLMNTRSASVALEDIELIEQYAALPRSADQGVVLHALAGLSNAVNSLKTAPSLPTKPGTPKRPDINAVQEEIRNAEHLILVLADKSLDTASKDRSLLQESRIEGLSLKNAYRYIMFSASGSADCHGAQVGVDGP
jgi:hypothetical protein